MLVPLLSFAEHCELHRASSHEAINFPVRYLANDIMCDGVKILMWFTIFFLASVTLVRFVRAASFACVVYVRRLFIVVLVFIAWKLIFTARGTWRRQWRWQTHTHTHAQRTRLPRTQQQIVRPRMKMHYDTPKNVNRKLESFLSFSSAAGIRWRDLFDMITMHKMKCTATGHAIKYTLNSVYPYCIA